MTHSVRLSKKFNNLKCTNILTDHEHLEASGIVKLPNLTEKGGELNGEKRMGVRESYQFIP